MDAVRRLLGSSSSPLHRAGERTAERLAPARDVRDVDGNAVTVVATRRKGGGTGVYHTVSTSTPTDKRLARVRYRDAKRGGSERTVLPLPPRRAAARSNQKDTEGDDAVSNSWGEWDDTQTSSVHHEGKRDEQRAGEDTLTRSTPREWRATKQSEQSLGSVSNSSLAFSVDRTRVAASAGGSTHNFRDDIVSRVATLKVLLDEGFLSQQEYERRKRAIIDELTFASRTSSVRRSELRSEARASFTPRNGIPLIVPHAPDFRNITPEVATKHVFDYDTRQWSTSQVYVALDETPFSKGSLRVVYHLQDLNELHFDGSYVAKVAIDPDEDPQTYFRDIELQAHCASYAEMYNSYFPPKRVEFLHAWVLELTERDGVLCAVEEYIPGDYRKHNNNFGSVSDDERNTPQAFSHFTYEASGHEVLAVDIQGVGDKYTDPQIHTLNGHDFGKGNLGVLGFQKFLSSHRCNSICRYLKLPQINPKDRHADRGTVPLQELMNRDRVRPTTFDSKHYYEHAPMLQKYIAHCRELEERQRRLDRERAGGAWKEQLCTRFTCGGGSACSIQ